MLTRRFSSLTFLACLVVGCSAAATNGGVGDDDAGAEDSATHDSGQKRDAATRDAETPDATADSSIDSSVDSSTVDASVDAARPDATGFDASHDSSTTVCAPADVSTFQPPTYKHANRRQGICTTQQIAGFYQGCLAPNATMQTCAPYGSTGTMADRDCAACIMTPDTATAYGALIEHSGTVSINIPGCMELKDTTNGLSCAQAYQASEACTDAACAANCPVTDDASFQLYEACIQQASANGCSTYSTAATCADAEADAGPAAVCFVGQSFQDLYNGVAPIFCGP